MCMAMDIENHVVNIEFDFTTLIANFIHKKLLEIKKMSRVINYRLYSLMCHMFLYARRGK